MSDDLSGFSLMELFRLEAESQTAVLSSGVLALEAGAIRPEMLEPLMRAAHSLKGAARIVGVDTAVRVAHALEDAFVAAQKGTVALGPAHGDVLLRAVDLLGQIAQVPDDQLSSWQAEHEPAVAAMVADLKALLSAERRELDGGHPCLLPVPPLWGCVKWGSVAVASAGETPRSVPSPPRRGDLSPSRYPVRREWAHHRRPRPRRPIPPSAWCA